MANSKSDMNFQNEAGTYTYDTSATFGDYTNANNTSIVVDIENNASIKVNNLNLNESTLNIESGSTFTVDNANNMNSGTINVYGTFVATQLTNLNSGTINIIGGTVDLEQQVLNNNGAVVDFNGNPNGILKVDQSNQLSSIESLTIKNFSKGNIIEVSSSGSGTLTTSYSDGVLTVTNSSGGTVATFNISEESGDNFTPTASYVNGYLVISCFLSGSLINTPSGLTTIEDLNLGDEIIAYVDGVETTRRVTWAGQAHCNVRQNLPLDQAGYPVRVLKDAIADGVPFKDLLVTAEHCLFFDGKFVPVRMLVNGRSIFFDKSITSYDYYHIETEAHSVIMADGMLTESYLDTGNRRSFSQKGNVVSIGSTSNLTWDDAAAPLTVSREAVEPIFRQLEARAERKAFSVQTEAQPLTHDHDLHLVTDTGATIRQVRENSGRVMFMIPAGVESVRVVSNASRPCDTVGPFVDDRRTLGVLVGDVRLFEGNTTATLTAHLQDADLSGWNNVEDGTMRWTDGNALLNLGQRPIGSIALMALQIHAAGPYLLADTASERAALQA